MHIAGINEHGNITKMEASNVSCPRDPASKHYNSAGGAFPPVV